MEKLWGKKKKKIKKFFFFFFFFFAGAVKFSAACLRLVPCTVAATRPNLPLTAHESSSPDHFFRHPVHHIYSIHGHCTILCFLFHSCLFGFSGGADRFPTW